MSKYPYWKKKHAIPLKLNYGINVPFRYHAGSERTNSFCEYLTSTPRFLPCALTTHTHWGPIHYHVRLERTIRCTLSLPCAFRAHNFFYEILTFTPRFLPCALTTHTHWGSIHYHVRFERTIRCTLSPPCALRAHKLEIHIFMSKNDFHEKTQ